MTRKPDKASPASSPAGPERRAHGHRVWSLVARTVRPLDGVAAPTFAERIAARSPAVADSAGPPIIPKPLEAPKPAARPSTAPLHDRGGERRVRRGKLEIGAKLDLHGYTQEKAEAALRRFLRAAREDGCAVVLVVTGKGGRLVSGESAPGILKRRLPEWLEKPDLRSVVSSFAQAHQRHGGAGAFYVFLKRKA